MPARPPAHGGQEVGDEAARAAGDAARLVGVLAGLCDRGLGRVFLGLPGLLAARLGSDERAFPIPLGFTGAVLELVLALAAFGVGVVALRKGERSWMVLVAFAMAVLVGGFWIFFALGEVLWPH